MANSYETAIAVAKVDFKVKLRSCTTRAQANRLVADIANIHALAATGSVQGYLRLLNDNPTMMTRRLPSEEMGDCETIIDVVYTFLEYDIARELEALIPPSLLEE